MSAKTNLSFELLSILKKLNTPQKIQDYLDKLPINHEKKGETCYSPKQVLDHNKAHCFEGALFACVALMIQGRKPLILSLDVTGDDWPHALALFKDNDHWGAISMTNHGVLGYRDPIYKTIRELAMTYFHEYFLTNGEKTMRGYSRPINLLQFGTGWITADSSNTSLLEMTHRILAMPHTQILTKSMIKSLRKASAFDIKLAGIERWKKSDKRT